jgi:hypothetical protein
MVITGVSCKQASSPKEPLDTFMTAHRKYGYHKAEKRVHAWLLLEQKAKMSRDGVCGCALCARGVVTSTTVLWQAPSFE